MKPVCTDNPVTMGIDVSHFQGEISWQDVKAYGVSFAFIKATEHASPFSVDSRFKYNWAQAKRVGLIRGAYHFFHPSEDPVAQANFFCNAVGELDDGDLPLMLDWETSDGTPTSKDVKAALTFLEAVTDRSGKTPILYSGPYFLQVLGCGPRFTKYPLCISHYGVNCPVIPLPWTDWMFWQKTTSGSVRGISGAVDIDVFNGTLEDLNKFTLSFKGGLIS